MTRLALAAAAALFIADPARAQDAEPAPAAQIERAASEGTDAEIADRIRGIFSQIEALSGVDVDVSEGVVTLRGSTAAQDAARRAEEIASRIAGVAAVENEIARDISVESRVSPVLEQTDAQLRAIFAFLPLLALALAVLVGIAFIGALAARWKGLWARLTPNPFVAELAQSTARLAFIVLGVVAALNLLDATWLLSAFLGAAGVLGLAVGFAVRDTIENYVASLMLSIRQPFRPNDHVVIDEREGRVIRLTSRATILMTLDGNHLRIPNASVFKAVILNYTANPQRRIDFRIGIGPDDDPIGAIEVGTKALGAAPFALKAPPPLGFVESVGDSNIVLYFGVWIDQRVSDFVKSRSAAVAATKTALERRGFSIPEPIFRLRFDPGAPLLLRRGGQPQAARPAARDVAPDAARADTSPERHIEQMVEAERRQSDAREDLLNTNAPKE